MLRFNYSIISKIVLSLLVMFALGGVFLILNKDEVFGEKTKQSTIVKKLPDFLGKLKKDWQTGDLEKAVQFKTDQCNIFKADLVSEDLLGCNRLYFDCLLESMEEANFSEYKWQDLAFIPQKNNNGSYLVEESNFVSLNILEKNSKNLFKVKLQKSCHLKKLPTAKYSAGPQTDSKFVWDNYLFDVFIDRYYVSRYDILNWAEKEGMPDLILEMQDSNLFFTPALTLPLEQQKKYCLAQGKKLLQSRFFDAATFYPSREQNIYKYPFTWTKSRSTFLNNSKKINTQNCQNAHVKECYSFSSTEKHSFSSVSWIGIHNSLGGHAESFDNLFNPQANLKLSHSNMERSSPWHRAGLRAYWSGNGIGKKNFDLVEQYTGRLIESNDDVLGVAFRCMDIR